MKVGRIDEPSEEIQMASPRNGNTEPSRVASVRYVFESGVHLPIFFT